MRAYCLYENIAASGSKLSVISDHGVTWEDGSDWWEMTQKACPALDIDPWLCKGLPDIILAGSLFLRKRRNTQRLRKDTTQRVYMF